MLKASNDRSETDKEMAFAPFNANFALHAFQPLMTEMAEYTGKAGASWLKINRHWMTFLEGRLNEDVALVHQLAKCAHPLDVLGVYSHFYHKALTDYHAEFTEVTRLTQMQLRA